LNPEVQTSIGMMQTIYKHLQEPEGCKHSLKQIMIEALQLETRSLGNHPKPESNQNPEPHNPTGTLDHEVQQDIR
jgi:hypothetical protein